MQTQVPPVQSPLQQGSWAQLWLPSAHVAGALPPVPVAVPVPVLTLVPAAPPLPGARGVLLQPTVAPPQARRTAPTSTRTVQACKIFTARR